MRLNTGILHGKMELKRSVYFGAEMMKSLHSSVQNMHFNDLLGDRLCALLSGTVWTQYLQVPCNVLPYRLLCHEQCVHRQPYCDSCMTEASVVHITFPHPGILDGVSVLNTVQPVKSRKCTVVVAKRPDKGCLFPVLL